MNKETLERMRQMHLYGMMNAFRSSLEGYSSDSMTEPFVQISLRTRLRSSLSPMLSLRFSAMDKLNSVCVEPNF